MPARPGAGRPSIYTPELAQRICEAIADGQSLRQICEASDMPNRQTVLNWQDTNPDFSAKYARARELQADYMDEEILEVTRRTIAGTLDPNVARVALLGLQWRAGRLNAKRYGERQQVDLNSKLTLEQIVAATMVPRAPKSTDT